jgi:hypothetical protein
VSRLPAAFLNQETHCEDLGLPFMERLLQILA